MESKRISILELNLGDKLASDVYRGDSLLLEEGTELDSVYLEKLHKMGIEYVDIFVSNVVEMNNHNSDLERLNKIRRHIDINNDTHLKNLNETYRESKKTLKSIQSKVLKKENIQGNLEKLYQHCNLFYNELDTSHDILELLRNLICEDSYLISHPIRVSLISGYIGKLAHLTKYEIIDTMYSAILHDIGKYRIDINLLEKTGVLSDSEYNELRSHVDYGMEILMDYPNIKDFILKGVYEHHEREDGSGYPLKKCGSNTSKQGKIIAIADCFDAITSTKCYRRGVSVYDGTEEIINMSFNKLNPELSTLFTKSLTKLYVGNRVILSNGEIGEVVYINPTNPTRPLIKSGDNFYDLSTSRIKVERVI